MIVYKKTTLLFLILTILNIQILTPAAQRPMLDEEKYYQDLTKLTHTILTSGSDVKNTYHALCFMRTTEEHTRLLNDVSTINAEVLDTIRAFLQNYSYEKDGEIFDVNLDELKIRKNDPQTLPYLLVTSHLWFVLAQLLEEDDRLTASKPNLQEGHTSYGSTPLLALCFYAQNFDLHKEQLEILNKLVDKLVKKAPHTLIAHKHTGQTPLDACVSNPHKINTAFFKKMYGHMKLHYPEILQNPELPELLASSAIQYDRSRSKRRKTPDKIRQEISELLETCNRQQAAPELNNPIESR